MAHDGCREVEWKGQPFSYLLHHPGGVAKSENYGTARHAQAAAAGHGDDGGGHGQHGGADRDATGTWNGPAPRGAGSRAAAAAAAAAATAAAAAARDADHVLLSSGQRMPLGGLGTYQLESADVVRAALELGYRHFDCARFYGNEAVVGEGLKGFVDAGRRDELFVVSKVWNTDHHPADARASVVASLADLGLARLDLVLLHWPEAWRKGSDPKGEVTPDTSITLLEAWRGLEALVDEGLAAAVGLSNCSLPQVEEVLAAARHKPAVHQLELHPLLAQRKLVGVCFRRGVASAAHTCLGRGREGLADSEVVQRVAREAGRTPQQVLLKWNVQRGVAVLPKATSREHLEANLVGLFDWRLTNEQKAAIDAMDQHRRFVDFPWKDWGSVEAGGVTKASRVVLGQQQAAEAAAGAAAP